MYLGFNSPAAELLGELSEPLVEGLVLLAGTFLLAYALYKLGIATDAIYRRVKAAIEAYVAQLKPELRNAAREFLWFMFDPYNQLPH